MLAETDKATKIAILGLLCAIAGNAYYACWIGQQIDLPLFYTAILIEWALAAFLGVLGIYLAIRSPKWLYLAWMGTGGLVSVTILSALSLIYFTLPTVLAYGTAAVLITGKRGRNLLVSLLSWSLFAVVVGVFGIVAHVLALRAVLAMIGIYS